MQTKISKKDEYLDKVSRFAAYVNIDDKTVGIYATHDDCLKAEKSHALKKLRFTYGFKIQMVIK